MSFARVVYPQPPPTSNNLTSQERSQLLRSTKKLGKVLGSTPHVVDSSHSLGGIHINVSVQRSIEKPHLEISDRPRSPDLMRRSPSISSESTMSYSSDSTDARSSLSSSGSMTSYTDSVNSADSWRMRKPTRKPPPLLRLISTTVEGPPSAIASVKPALETIPASPPADGTADDSNSMRHSPRSISFAAFGPPRPPSFEIPSESSIRWEKMERIRRKLGDEVPTDEVFPSEVVEGVTFDLVATAIPPSISGSQNMRRSVDGVSPRPSQKSSFSLEKPLFAIVESDDQVSGCFEFGSKKDKRRHR